MSENNSTPEELVEDIEYEVEDAEVVPAPIDPTLTHAGEAADAKATGDAIRNISSAVKVNNQAADNTGNITLLAGNIPMTAGTGAQTVAQAIEAAQAMTAGDILYAAEEEDTIADVIGGISSALESGCTDEEIDAIFDDLEEDEE